MWNNMKSASCIVAYSYCWTVFRTMACKSRGDNANKITKPMLHKQDQKNKL